jgi:hypothetical protein
MPLHLVQVDLVQVDLLVSLMHPRIAEPSGVRVALLSPTLPRTEAQTIEAKKTVAMFRAPGLLLRNQMHQRIAVKLHVRALQRLSRTRLKIVVKLRVLADPETLPR